MYDFSKLIFPLLNQPFNIFDPCLSSMSIIFFSNLKILHNSNGYSTENMSGRAHIFHESFEKLKIYQQVLVSKSLYCKVSEAKRTAQT